MSQGLVARLGAGQLALYKVAQKKNMHRFQFLEVGFPWSLECWAGEFCCSLSSLCWAWLEGLALTTPTAAPASGYTSVEKYSVFRFSSAKEIGGCCR